MELDSRYKNSFINHVLPLAAVFGMGLGLAGYAHAQEQQSLHPSIPSSSALPIIPDESFLSVTSIPFDLQDRESVLRKDCRRDVELGMKLDWPVFGIITQGCSNPHYGAIDMAVPTGTKVKTAAEGDVVFVGGNPCCGLGYYVVVDNGNGVETTYGHLSGFATTKGSHVEKDEVIGRAGSTGISSGPHLHFELTKDHEFLDPLGYLP